MIHSLFVAADWTALWAAGGPAAGLDAVLGGLADLAPDGSFFSRAYNLRALLALVLVSLTCGAVGPLVVGGRLAFFSDALAHCAFASVSIGFLLFTFVLAGIRPAEEFWDWVTPVMIGFALLVGYAIAVTREKTGLASDTVIGIFFAFAIGLAAMLRKVMAGNRRLFTLEDVLFGDPLLVESKDVLYLAFLLLLTALTLSLTFNSLFLSGFNSSLALSRRVRLGLVQRSFILLLAVVVTLCVRTVGVLLINALLVVPAATAANLSRNLRQMFWLSVGACLASSLGGLFLVWEIESRTRTRLGIPGVIILLSSAFFILSAVVAVWRQRRAAAAEARPN